MDRLQLLLLITGIVLLLAVVLPMRKGRIPIKYAIVWFLPISVVLLFALLPDFLWMIVRAFGFVTISNFITGLFIVILFYICITLVIIVSGQTKKISLLVQEISLLKSKINRDYESNEKET